MFKRILSIFIARNKEFYRDTSALGWNILFPLLVIVGFSMLFSEERQAMYKVGIINDSGMSNQKVSKLYENIKNTKYITYVDFDSEESALKSLKKHKIDMVIQKYSTKYWVSKTSPKSYISEKLLYSNSDSEKSYKKMELEGQEIPYIEWLFPGILGMNMMFSSLFGIGFVVVRYRKNGALKRLSVTPMKAYEFLTAQIISRILILMLTTIFVYTVCSFIYGFECRGSYFTLLLLFALGGFSMISLGLLVASRSSSEEFAGGILNLITWPMMFLSEVWFSLEGASEWIKKVSHLFPLTQMIDGARRVMNEGAGIADVSYNLLALSLMSIVFISLGSYLFKWNRAN